MKIFFLINFLACLPKCLSCSSSLICLICKENSFLDINYNCNSCLAGYYKDSLGICESKCFYYKKKSNFLKNFNNFLNFFSFLINFQDVKINVKHVFHSFIACLAKQGRLILQNLTVNVHKDNFLIQEIINAKVKLQKI